MRRLAVAFGVLISTPAVAHWQWTSWGMTPSQVVASAPAKIAPYSDPKLDTNDLKSRLVTTHHAMGFDFSVAMLFDSKTQGLAQIRLLLRDSDGSQCSALEGELTRVYGPPETVATMGFRRWRNHEDLISLRPLGGCWLVYEPIPSNQDSGL